MSNKNLFTSTKSDAKIDQLSRVFSRASDHVDQTRVDVSVVLPVFNEEDAISSCVKEIIDTLLPEGLNFEIVAINDGSTDLSEQIVLGLCREYPKILRIASHIQNKGNGAALRTGIRLSGGEVVVLMDSDGQHSANEIPRLLALIPPYDMVVGTRTAKYQGAWYRNLANRIYNHFASWLTKFPIPDLASGFRAMRRHAVMHFLPIYPSGFSSSATATMAFLKAGYSVCRCGTYAGMRRAVADAAKALAKKGA